MPSILSSLAASGEGCGGASVDLGDKYSKKGVEKPSGRTRWLGKNLRAYSKYQKLISPCNLIKREKASTPITMTHIRVWRRLRLDEYRSLIARRRPIDLR